MKQIQKLRGEYGSGMTTHTLDDANLSQPRDTLHATFTNPCYTARIWAGTPFRNHSGSATAPFPFLDGTTAVYDWQPVTDLYNVSPTPQSADARAMASDFFITGNDMRAALSEYARTQ